MTTLKELADRALASGEAEIFFQVLGSSDVFHVCPSGHGNPEIFFAFNTSTSNFQWVSGNSLVEETAAPRGKGYRGFNDLKPVQEEVRR